MTKLLVQEYLETHTLGELAKEHGVYATFSKSGHKASFNYDMLETQDDDLLARDCRGLILSAKDGHSFLGQAKYLNGKPNYDHVVMGKTHIIAFGLRRFFNYGQGSADPIDFTDPNIIILEKKDGTLSQCYFDKFIGRWCVSTRSVPEADLLMDNGIFTFRTLFEKCLVETTGLSFDDYTAKLDKEITYCFEICSPLNRIVCAYPDNTLTFIGARRISYETHKPFSYEPTEEFVKIQELDIREVPSFGVPLVPTYDYQTIDQLLVWVASRSPSEHEGLVLRDAKFNRVKIKSDAYLSFSKLRDSLGNSERNCLTLILNGKEDDAIPFLPKEIVENLLSIKAGLQRAMQDNDMAYEVIFQETNAMMPGDKKTFALAVNEAVQLRGNKLWAPYFFNRWDHKSSSIKEFIMSSQKLGSWGDSFLDRLLEISKAHFS